MPGPPVDAVKMSVGKTRRDEAAAEVDDLGAGTDVATHRGRRADGDEAPVLDGEAFRDRRSFIGREYLAIDEDQIGGLGGGRRCERDTHRNNGAHRM